MPTLTDERCSFTINIPKPMLAILEQESELTGLKFAPLMRRMIQWHRGKAPGRHQDAPPVELPKVTKRDPKKATKGLLIDVEDAEYLDKIGQAVGLTRVTAMQVVFTDWFGLGLCPPARSLSYTDS